MIGDGIALGLLALLLAYDFSCSGLRTAYAVPLAALGVVPLVPALIEGLAPGLPLVGFGAYGLGTRLSHMGAGRDDRARLPAALAAGALALTGPFGAVGACSAIVIHALADRTRPRAEALMVGAVLLFVPLTLLLAIMATAFIQNGDVWSIEAGGGVFLRGAPLAPDGAALRLLVPAALPLLLFALPVSRAAASGPLALAGGGLVAALLFMSAAPLAPFLIGAALAAAAQPRRASLKLPVLLAATGLAGFALMGMPDTAPPVPLAGSWQVVPAVSTTPLAWGAPRWAAGAPLPEITREAGRYVLHAPQQSPVRK
jgi:hypothetical protein